MNNEHRVFGVRKPVIAMAQFGALPGAPRYDREGGRDAIVEGARRDAVKRALRKTPVLAQTGVKHATIGAVLRVGDGRIVGSALKVGGDAWKSVARDRAAEFTRIARAARGR
jgi:predicted TIM-barrel enzyme